MVIQRSRAGSFLVALGLFLLAFALRCMTWPRVMPAGPSGPIFLFGTDAYYHMRRILYTVANFPSTLRFDPYVNFPNGGEPIWPATFDFVIAVLALPFHDGSDVRSVERIAIFVPPLLGGATVVALYGVARKCFDAHIALVAGLTLSILSGHFWYSQLGFVDHHAAVALLSTVLLGAALLLLQALSAANQSRDVRYALLTGAAMAALLGVWPGGLLHVVIVEIALLCALAFNSERRGARRAARASLIMNTLAAVLMIPAAATAQWTHWGAFSPTVLSNFQLWFFTTLALHAMACLALSPRTTAGLRRERRWLPPIAIGALLLGASAVLFPGLIDGASHALRWLLKEETFQRVVAESTPLFTTPEGFGTHVAEARLSRFLYLTPVAALVMVIISLRAKKTGGSALLLLVFWSMSLFGVTLLQRRFFNSFSVALALMTAWSVVSVWRRLASAAAGTAAPHIARATSASAVLVVTLWLLWPVLDAYRAPIDNVRQALAGDFVRLPPGLVRQRAFRRAALWLRANSPETRGWLDADARPQYAVLAGWMHGHMIEYVARRPSVADNFGDDIGPENFLASYRYFEADGDEAERILTDLCARYVLFRTATGSDLTAFPEESMNYRLSGPSPDVEHLRMIYDEPMPRRGGVSQIRIFESRSHDEACRATRQQTRSNSARAVGGPIVRSG